MQHLPDAKGDGEYREMPGLRLTVPQACRLWQLDPVMCESLLNRLMLDRFLLRTPSGAYMAAPRPTAAKVATTNAADRRSA